MTTLERLEKIVEKQIAEDAFTGKITIAHFVSDAEPTKRAGVLARCLSGCLILRALMGSRLRRLRTHL